MKNNTNSPVAKVVDDVSVVLPVYNEFETIEYVLKEWTSELNRSGATFNIILCEDGSTDGTSQLLKKIQKKYSLVLSQKEIRRGYGGAVIDGILAADAKFILSIDSDGQCDPADFARFWSRRWESDVLIGRRVHRADAEQRKFFSFLFRQFFNILFPTFIHDPSAPFVLYKKEQVVPLIPYLRYLKEGFWWGFIGTCIKKKINVIEIPINHRERLAGDTQVYKISKLPSIIVRNLLGLVLLRLKS